MEKQLPLLYRPSIHVFKTVENKLTIHTNDNIRVGNEIKIGGNRVIVLNVVKSEQSGYYHRANYYELEFQTIIN